MKAVKKLSSNGRKFCRTCGVLFVENEAPKHLDHSIVSPVSDQQLQRPSTLLHAIDNSRTNAVHIIIITYLLLLLLLRKLMYITNAHAVNRHEKILLSPEKKRFKEFFE